MTSTDLAPPTTPPLIIAHRGDRSHAPENTLAAAESALRRGAHMWELDVCLSADGVPVVIHDDTLPRTTDIAAHHDLAHLAPWRVCALTLAEIRRLDAGSWFVASDPFKTIAAHEIDKKQLENYRGCRVPTLEEALRFTRDNGWRVNVEIKDHEQLKGDETVTRRVVEMIRSLDMVESVLLSSFQHRYLAEAHVLLPELARAVLVEDTAPTDPLALCRKYSAVAYHPDYELVTAEEVSRLRDAGIQINVWTVNDSDQIRALALMGASGIITDDPARTQKILTGFTMPAKIGNAAQKPLKKDRMF